MGRFSREAFPAVDEENIKEIIACRRNSVKLKYI